MFLSTPFYSHTTNNLFSQYSISIQCHNRKLKTRQGDCELLPMTRRRLQKKPRMQPAQHDLEANSFVFDHSELDTKLSLFMLFALRNCNICYSSAKRMQCKTTSFWIFNPNNVWEKNVLTDTAGTKYAI